MQLLALPEDLLLRTLALCSPRGLLRAMQACRKLQRLARTEALWCELLAELWARSPRSSQYSARCWWLSRVSRRCLHGGGQQNSANTVPCVLAVVALPWRCAQTAQCQLIRQLSYRESYKACLHDRKRESIYDEELVSLRWTVDFGALAPMASLPEHLRPTHEAAAQLAAQIGGGPDSVDDENEQAGGVPACFHRDGCYEDSIFNTRAATHCQWGLHHLNDPDVARQERILARATAGDGGQQLLLTSSGRYIVLREDDFARSTPRGHGDWCIKNSMATLRSILPSC